MTDRFTLTVPPALVAALAEKLQRVPLKSPAVDSPVMLDRDEAAGIAQLAAAMLAPQLHVAWGDDRIATNQEPKP